MRPETLTKVAAVASDEAATPFRRRPRSRLAIAGNVVFAVLFGFAATVWFVALRPISLHGSADYVVVRGTSMLPTYQGGDLIITERKATYGVDDVIAFVVPAGEPGAGLTVIHRIVGGSSTTGFITRGDNNPTLDDWRPTSPDIRGVPWLRVPRGGTVLFALRSPAMLASLAAAIAVTMFLYPPMNRTRRSPPIRRSA